jgi:hypothetical protein
MKAERKITANLPEALLEKAMEATGEGLTPTLRRGLELVAAQTVYENLLKTKGKYPKGIEIHLEESRDDQPEDWDKK